MDQAAALALLAPVGVVVERRVLDGWVLWLCVLGVRPVLPHLVVMLVVVLCVPSNMWGIRFWPATSLGSIVRAMGDLA